VKAVHWGDMACRLPSNRTRCGVIYRTRSRFHTSYEKTGTRREIVGEKNSETTTVAFGENENSKELYYTNSIAFVVESKTKHSESQDLDSECEVRSSGLDPFLS